jgi:hypothetical protein
MSSKFKFKIVKFISIYFENDDKKYEILNRKVYDMFNRPIKFITEEEIFEIEKPDIPICDICNSDAEYGLIEYDNNEEYLTDCFCERCMEEVKKNIERDGYGVIVK